MKATSLVAPDNIILSAVPGALESADELVRVPEVERRRPEQTLRQQPGPFRPVRRLTLFNGHYLESVDDDGRGPARVINLAYVSGEPLVIRENAWRWMVVALVSLAGATLTAAFGQASVAVVLGALTALCLLMYFALSRSRLVFRTRYGGIAVFEIYHGLAGRRATLEFARLVQERVRGAAVVLPAGDRRLAAEIAEHRRMLLEGWLSRSRYDLAKKRIFARYRRSGG